MELETSIEVIPNIEILEDFGIFIDIINKDTTHVSWAFMEELN